MGNHIIFKSIRYLIILLILGKGISCFLISINDTLIQSVDASVVTVDINGNGDYLKIQDAIDNATNGDIIHVWAGTYYENVIVNKPLILKGNGMFNTTINGSETKNVIHVTANNVCIKGFSIENSGDRSELGDPSGIKIDNINNITIYEINCSNNNYGINIINSNSIRIENNFGFANEKEGIRLFNSNNNTIKNNTFHYSKDHNLKLYMSDNNIILNNSFNSTIRWRAIDILSSNNNIIKDNYACFNKEAGMNFDGSKNNSIIGNICLYNNEGIEFYGSSYNNISNNICNNNRYGIDLFRTSNFNKIIGNNCTENEIDGIIVSWNSTNNIIESNLCLNNAVGIKISDSSYNYVKNNTCNNNTNNGIQLFIDHIPSNNNITVYNVIENNTCINNANGINAKEANFNTIKQNVIANNSNTGFSIAKDCFNNNIYYNHILNNKNQALDAGNNYWNNSNLEGNYWSDYLGIDDGSGVGKHSVAGDGIGDTLIPHLGLDYYPFTNQVGWLKPGTPILDDPYDVNNDGTYNLSWIQTARTLGYILEEDNNSSFDSPLEIYNGSSIKFNISGKKNSTYYYRVKAYNEKYESPWSNTVDIIVDWLPDIPKNLSTSIYPPGNSLNLTWDLNFVDTDQYILEYKNETMLNWEQTDPILHPDFCFNHTGLVDGLRYDYRILAKDYRGQLSNYSEIISGMPWDSVPPAPPIGLNVILTTNDSISLKWNANTEDDLEGYHIFRSEFDNNINWGKPIDTITKGTEEYLDNGLNENSTYYYVLTAFDEVPNNSSYSNLAFGTTIIGQHKPEINMSQDDFSISEDTIDDSTIKLYRWFRNIDNDSLKFKCLGQNNISVTIFQENGSVILIPKKDWNGQETLTFYANDSYSEVSDKVTITVTPVNDPPGPAVIITPEEGIKVENGTKINFSGICDDVDIIYGDILTYTWSSNISGNFGSSENLTNILLASGNHQITLEVSDFNGEKAVDSINIMILPEIIPNINNTPKIDFMLELIPNSVQLKSGEQITINAIVTNLGEKNDNFTVQIGDINNSKITAENYRQDTMEIPPGKNKEFLIMISVEENTKPGFENITITVKSKLAEKYNLDVQDNKVLTIKILEKDDQKEKERGLPISIFYFSILLFIIILIVISIIILMIVRKKSSKKESKVVETQDIQPETTPGSITTPEPETTVEPLPVVTEQQDETIEE